MKLFVPIASLIVLVLVGCAGHPMGMTDSQWTALSPQQKEEYTAKQAQINEQQKQERRARWKERARIAEAGDRQADERVSAIRANPKYGDIVDVLIEGGVIGIGQRHSYQPVRFELARGESKGVLFRRQDKPGLFRMVNVQLSEDGKTFLMDPGMHEIRIVNDGWETGRNYSPNEVKDDAVGTGARGISIRIRFKDIPR